MPFNHRNKELLGGGTATCLYAYTDTEELAEVMLEEDYFRNMTELRVGDWMKIRARDAVFEAVVKCLRPTVLGPPDFPWIGEDNINVLRARCKEKGINSFGKSKEELARLLAAA